MKRPTKRQLGILLVVALVAMAGCIGGGGGDGGDDSGADTTTAVDGSGGDGTDATTDGGTDATTTAGDGSGGDGMDATTTDDADGTTTTAAPTTTDDGDGGPSESRHSRALREAGSYTVTLTFDSAGQSRAFRITQKTELASGERYAVVESGENTYEYYQPPDSETAYQYVQGQAREIPASEAFFFNATDVDSTAQNEFFDSARRAGTGRTDLGPANKWVIDSADDLPESTRDQWDEIESVRLVLFVDQDTGIVAKYDYEITGIQSGEESTATVSYEITDLGSTTVETPDWVPE